MYVYLICDPANETFKIGITSGKIENRIKKLQTGNSTKLFISQYYYSKFYREIEYSLHKIYFNKRTDAENEWFNLTIDDINNFQNTCKKLESRMICALSKINVDY